MGAYIATMDTAQNINKVRVMLVDDEPDVREFLSYNLKKHGFDVYTCANGNQAVKTARRVQPHIVIMDVIMPGMDGIEACRIIRNDEMLKNTIIAFFSAKNESYANISGFSAGADDYIYKPSGPGVVVARIKALLEKFMPSRFPATVV
jgi:two-component system, OmpR family, alkaline phosphatase synthesis response regulator PhoP